MFFRRMVQLATLPLALVGCGGGGGGGAGAPPAATEHVLWSSSFPQPIDSVSGLEDYWGRVNVSYSIDSATQVGFMRISIPKGTYDPGSMMAQGKPVGGAGFKLRVMPAGTHHAIFTYLVRFPPDFDFVLGGKLPGLFGGAGNTGGNIPTGEDGFSFRLMWGTDGFGTVYAYLPTSVTYGTPLLFKKFSFKRGQWHKIRQEVELNTPGRSDGLVRIWLDDVYIGTAEGLLVRTVDSLKINGIFCEVFFGGNDPSWASTKDTYVDLADFKFSEVLN
jgi:hypothetical protein